MPKKRIAKEALISCMIEKEKKINNKKKKKSKDDFCLF